MMKVQGVDWKGQYQSTVPILSYACGVCLCFLFLCRSNGLHGLQFTVLSSVLQMQEHLKMPGKCLAVFCKNQMLYSNKDYDMYMVLMFLCYFEYYLKIFIYCSASCFTLFAFVFNILSIKYFMNV